MRIFGLIASAAVLTACVPAHDDPTNLPQLGRWSKEVRLAGLTIDDRSVDRDEIPFALPQNTSEIERCTEPKLRSADEVNAMLQQTSKAKSCAIESIDTDGASIDGTGHCTLPSSGGMSGGGTIRMTGEQGADAIRTVNAIGIQVHSPDGQTHEVRTSYVLEWKRLGKCA